jgi:outer membrane lipoprotein carrier protein
MRRHFLPIACIAMLFNLPSHAGEGRQALDDYLNGFTTLTSKFDQTLTNEKGTIIDTSRGTVYLQRPGKFRWEYESPYEQSIVGDGEKVWIYDKDLEQVTVKPMQKVLGSTPALILGGDTRIDDRFMVTEQGVEEGVAWLSLQPKDADSQYTGIRIGFTDDGRLRGMDLSDNFGQVTRLRFSEDRRNEPVEAEQFIFTPPAGVDVNDLTAPKQ